MCTSCLRLTSTTISVLRPATLTDQQSPLSRTQTLLPRKTATNTRLFHAPSQSQDTHIIGMLEFPEFSRFSRAILKIVQTFSTKITPEFERTYSTFPLSNNYSRPYTSKICVAHCTLKLNKYYFIVIKYKGFTFLIVVSSSQVRS